MAQHLDELLTEPEAGGGEAEPKSKPWRGCPREVLRGRFPSQGTSLIPVLICSFAHSHDRVLSDYCRPEAAGTPEGLALEQRNRTGRPTSNYNAVRLTLSPMKRLAMHAEIA